MRLRTSNTTPYGRKVSAVIIERGLSDRVDIVPTDPWAADTDLPKDNPMGKVPTLVLDDGTAMFDSSLLCEYLDAMAEGGPLLYPQDGEARWRIRRLDALATGLIDASVTRVVDRRRPADLQSKDWQDRQKAAMTRACDALEQAAGTLETEAVSIAHLATACALGYLDLRFADDGWRDGRPRLAAWYEGFKTRPAIAETAPPV